MASNGGRDLGDGWEEACLWGPLLGQCGGRGLFLPQELIVSGLCPTASAFPTREEAPSPQPQVYSTTFQALFLLKKSHSIIKIQSCSLVSISHLILKF